jgi:hypothetical protein
MQKLLPQTVNIADPGATKRLPLFKVPAEGGSVTIADARIVCDTALVNGDTNVRSYALQNGGADGTETTVVAPAISNSVADGGVFAVGVPREFTPNEATNTLNPGDWLVLVYTKTGTDAPKNTTMNYDLALGKR